MLGLRYRTFALWTGAAAAWLRHRRRPAAEEPEPADRLDQR
jgi:hypothetical protein